MSTTIISREPNPRGGRRQGLLLLPGSTCWSWTNPPLRLLRRLFAPCIVQLEKYLAGGGKRLLNLSVSVSYTYEWQWAPWKIYERRRKLARDRGIPLERVTRDDACDDLWRTER